MCYNSYLVLEQAPLGIDIASNLSMSLLSQLNFLWKINIYDHETNSLSSFYIFNNYRTISHEKKVLLLLVFQQHHVGHAKDPRFCVLT